MFLIQEHDGEKQATHLVLLLQRRLVKHDKVDAVAIRLAPTPGDIVQSPIKKPFQQSPDAVHHKVNIIEGVDGAGRLDAGGGGGDGVAKPTRNQQQNQQRAPHCTELQ